MFVFPGRTGAGVRGAFPSGSKFKDASKASDQDAILTQYILKIKTNIKRATMNKVLKF